MNDNIGLVNSAVKTPGPRTPGGPQRKREVRRPVLIVDDEAAIRATLVDILTGHGYPVRTAGNGAEALQIIGNVLPAVVLLDMRMPVMDGWAFAKELKERGIKVPLVVMAPNDSVARWCMEVGGVEPLGKPFDMRHLLHAVERAYRKVAPRIP